MNTTKMNMTSNLEQAIGHSVSNYEENRDDNKSDQVKKVVQDVINENHMKTQEIGNLQQMVYNLAAIIQEVVQDVFVIQ